MRRPAAGGEEFDCDHPLDRRGHRPARGLRLGPLGWKPDRHPVHRRPRRGAKGACLLRLRRRVGPRAVSDSGGREDRGRKATARAYRRLSGRARCTSSMPSSAPAAPGTRGRARSGASDRIGCGPPAGRLPMRPAWRSSPVSPATTRSRAERSAMRSGSQSSERGARTCILARHFASDLTDSDLPPMGLRVRLKASFPIGGFPRQARVVLQALERYGMILADNGSNWFISGAPDPRWFERRSAHARSRAGLGLRGRRHLDGTPEGQVAELFRQRPRAGTRAAPSPSRAR